MTTRERIAKGIQDHDRAIDEARQTAVHLVNEPTPSAQGGPKAAH